MKLPADGKQSNNKYLICVLWRHEVQFFESFAEITAIYLKGARCGPDVSLILFQGIDNELLLCFFEKVLKAASVRLKNMRKMLHFDRGTIRRRGGYNPLDFMLQLSYVSGKIVL